MCVVSSVVCLCALFVSRINPVLSCVFHSSVAARVSISQSGLNLFTNSDLVSVSEASMKHVHAVYVYDIHVTSLYSRNLCLSGGCKMPAEFPSNLGW